MTSILSLPPSLPFTVPVPLADMKRPVSSSLLLAGGGGYFGASSQQEAYAGADSGPGSQFEVNSARYYSRKSLGQSDCLPRQKRGKKVC